MSEKEYIDKQNKYLPDIQKWVDEKLPGIVIPYSATYERKNIAATP
jgi:hypothetical protein